MLIKTKYQLKAFKKQINFAGLAVSFFVLLFGDCFGQSIAWQRTYDSQFHGYDVAEDICDAGNGNFFIVGTSQRNNSYSSIYIIKINKFGDTLWARTIDTAYGKAVTPSGDGGCVVTGWRDGAFTSKLDSLGNMIWFKVYTPNIIFSGNDIIKTQDGGYIICAVSYYNQGYVIKFDSLGDIQWQRFYTSGGEKGFSKIICSNDGGYILTGSLSFFPNDTTRGLITKIDTMGNIVWEKTFVLGGNTGNWDIDKTNNSFVVCGDVNINNNFRVFYKKFDFEGNELYSKVFFSDDNESTSRIKILNDNKYIMSMSRLTNSFPFRYYSKVIITDSIGNITNQREYNALGDLNIFSILPVINRDIIFVGEAEFYAFPIKSDVYALRTDSLLNAPPPIGIENINNNFPQDYFLINYPNPFNPSTKIRYKVPISTDIKIIIFDIQGKEIETLVNENKTAGNYEINWIARNLSSGIYFLTLFSENNIIISKKIILLK